MLRGRLNRGPAQHECARHGPVEITIQTSGNAILDDIDWAWHIICRDWRATSHGFQHHQSECVGSARKHHDISIGQGSRVGLIFPATEETGIGISSSQPLPLRPAAYQNLATCCFQTHEIFDPLSDGEAARIQDDGSWESKKTSRKV